MDSDSHFTLMDIGLAPPQSSLAGTRLELLTRLQIRNLLSEAFRQARLNTIQI